MSEAEPSRQRDRLEDHAHERGDALPLPVDSDVEVGPPTRTGHRPAPPRPADLVPVVLGGAVGTSLREAVSLLLGPTALPWATAAVNLTGAFALGLLLELLSRGGPDAGRRRTLRLLLGTGLLGGYTTYSALALDTARLDQPGLALGYAGGTLALGAAASLAGIVLGARLSGRDGRGRR